MHLNTLSPAPGRVKNRKRVGRGIGSGWGKTAGRGHKGLKARSGGKVAPGFEGGQMPLRKRLPKYGFRSRVSFSSAEVRLGELNRVEGDVVDMDALMRADLIGRHVKSVKVFASGELSRALSVVGLRVSKGAKAAIEAAGGSVKEADEAASE